MTVSVPSNSGHVCAAGDTSFGCRVAAWLQASPLGLPNYVLVAGGILAVVFFGGSKS